MRVAHIDHVAIICSDYERSKDFYVNILGFKIINETYRTDRHSYKLDLRVSDECQIELFSFPIPPPRVTNPEACGLRHLALRVNNLDAVRQELIAQGVAVEEVRIDEVRGTRFFFAWDLDKLPLEFVEDTK